MPSEGRVDRALESVTGSREAYRSAVARAVDQVRGLLERQRAAAGESREALSLGRMAEGRVDPERFAGLVADSDVLDPDAREQVERALEVLEDIDRAGDAPFRAAVEPGTGLRSAVAGRLARAGRAFGAARTVELARSGRFTAEEHGEFAERFPPAMWNRREREVAPPLVAEVPGEELSAGGLAEFLDGSQKLVLVVEGPAPPAALVRLITPGVLVMQTDDPEELGRLDDFDGPAVGALFAGGSGAFVRFLHDPAGGPTLRSRLVAGDLPEEGDLRPVGSATRFQQAEEVRQLRALAGAAEPGAGTENGGAPEEAEEAEPADRLAAWLLRQANLRDLE